MARHLGAAQRVALLAGLGLAGVGTAARAASTTVSTFGGTVNVGSNQYANNNTWGYSINGWGGGVQSVTADPANTSSTYWRTDFNWWNNSNVQWDQYHIKAFPSCVLGWQWGFLRPNTGLPIQLSANRNVNVTWSFDSSHVPNWAKWDAVYDMWLDPSSSPSGQPSDEVMIFVNYTDGVPPSSGYIETVTLGGSSWDVYRSQGSWQVISFVARNRSNYANFNIRDFLNYTSATKGWISSSKNLLSVQTGFEIWYGQGYFQSWQDAKSIS